MKLTELDQADRLRRKYLKALSRRLWTLPVDRRSEIERELTSHLEWMVIEKQCESIGALEATQAALRQFGRPARVGRGIAWQWHKENFMKTPKFVGSLGFVTVLLSGAWLAFMGSAMSHFFFPDGKILIQGGEGAQVSVQHGVMQVASGEAAVLGVNPTLMALAIGVPFALVSLIALAGCIGMMRRRTLT